MNPTIAAIALGARARSGFRDAELLRLGSLLDEAAAREAEAWAVAEVSNLEADDKRAETLNRRTSAVVQLIEQQTATTLPGILVKVRALAWCCAGEPITAEELYWPHGSPTTDKRLLAQVVADLSAIGSAGL